MNKTPFFWLNKDKPAPPFHYKTTASFYASPAWRNLRAYKLSISPFCERCSKPGRLVAASEVHHKTEISVNPDLALEIDNTESLCKTCHSKESYKHIQEARKPAPQGHIINLKSKLKNESDKSKPGTR